MVSILLVEDDAALRKQICFSLESTFRIFEAGNQKEAIDALKSNKIDIVILDLGLPPHEGTPDEGLKVLDHILDKYTCKVIILTGQRTEGIALEAIKSGAFDYLIKPASMEKIHYSIERALLFKETEKQLERQGIKKISIEVEMGKGLQTLRDEADKSIILRILRDTNFNVYQSAKILGVKRESLYYFLRKFGVKRTDDD
ncbi:MAG: two component transcriptional regulator, Fis family [Deltaproteobacteria bacterium]|jgi:DNA-binding NtrC family response regulator|nr:two component transcriptional regulator, Fis family [Deltaproteobacteria bacterium]